MLAYFHVLFGHLYVFEEMSIYIYSLKIIYIFIKKIKNWFIYFNWRLITILWWFLPYVDMNHPWVYMCPEPHFYLPPHPIPLGCPRAPTLSALFYASNLDWSSISHMVIYMFQCYSPKSSHPCLLPQSPKVCFYLCVSFAVSHIGSLLSSF